MSGQNPVVSVLCTCYNHEKYIAQAIEGFLKQKTTFPFEVLIHDDASTDASAQIIREYADRHPDLIIPVLQTENQFSKGVKVSTMYLLPKARGEFIALCEGDDYWTDPQKLQLQWEYMSSHPQCMLCSHANREISEDGTPKGEMHYTDHDSDVTLEDCLGSANPLFQTATYFLRRTLYDGFSKAKDICPVGDYSLCIEATMKGPIHYIDRVMSDYRMMSSSSWSSRMAKSSEFRERHALRFVHYFETLQEVLHEDYELIAKLVDFHEGNALLNGKSPRDFYHTGLYKKLPFLKKAKYHLRIDFPSLYSFLVNFKQKNLRKDYYVRYYERSNTK